MLLYLKITINDKKLLISVYSKPDDSHLYLDDASFHPAKSINGILTGAAKQLKQTRSNDIDFLEQVPRVTRSQRRLPELSKKIISNQYQPFSIKEQKAI